MALYVNGTKIKSVYANGVKLSQLYGNGVKVWNSEVEYVGGVSQNVIGTTTYTIDTSSIGIQSGDMIIVANSNGYHTSSPFPPVPTGFTSLFYRSGGSSSRNAILRVSYMRATSAVTSITVPNGCAISSSGGGVVVHVFRNVNATTPFDTALTSLSGNTNTNNVNPLPITTVTDGSMIVAAGCSFSSPNAGAYTAAGNMIGMKYGTGSSTNYGSTCGMAYYLNGTAGTFDPTSWTYTGPTSGANHMTCTIALRPA